MTPFNFRLSVFLSGLLFLFVCVNVQAQDKETTTTTTTTEITPENGAVTKVIETTRRTIVTPVPVAKEVITIPQGFVSCFNVEAGWFNDTWVPSHRVCQYTNSGEGVVWIEGYWGCNQATAEGVCTNWEWKAAHWEKTLIVY